VQEPDPKPLGPTAGSVIATLYYWAVFVPTITFGFCLLTLLWIVTTPFDPQRKACHRFVNDWVHTYLKIWPGWRVRIKGQELIPPGRPAVLVANHQSVADVLACMGVRRQFKFVSKGSLFTLPIVGWGMKMMKYVSVERGRPRSMHHMIEECRGWLRQGMSVLIFPEGTYASARELLPFKRGAFKLAIEEKAPVVPIAVRGTRSLVVEDGPWMSPRAEIEIEVLPPIPAEALGTDEKQLAERVRVILSEAVGRPDPVGSPKPIAADEEIV
jgi:1-acyl-sn-glycerol-3-phosphate acyltransferase